MNEFDGLEVLEAPGNLVVPPKPAAQVVPKPLELLERLKYRAPFKSFDPRSFDTWHTKHLYPIKYLDSIGIEIICDLLLNQFSPKEISIMLQISQHILMRWVEADSIRAQEWEWAYKIEADNLMYEAKDRLEDAFVPPDKHLDKAEKIANHSRIMAKGLGPKRWGQKVDVTGIGATAQVIYNFNVALLPEQQEKLVRQTAIEHKAEVKTDFNFKDYLGSGLNALDLTIPKDNMTYEEAKAQETN